MNSLQPETVEKIRAAFHAVADAVLTLQADPGNDKRHGGVLHVDCYTSKHSGTEHRSHVAHLSAPPEHVADIVEAFRHAIG